METDAGRQTGFQEEQISDRRSHSSNYRHCSQSRKISIGVLVDSISQAKTKDIQEPGVKTAEIGNYSKKGSVKDGEGHSPPMERHTIAKQKDASPWISTRSFNPNKSYTVADQDTERTPSFPATRRGRPRSKLLQNASAAHSLKFFAAKSGLESDVRRQKDSGKDISSIEAGMADNADHAENPVCSTEQGVRQDKEKVQGKDRTEETGGRESLRIKLWEILGDVSSPNKHISGHQCEELHMDQEKNGKQGPIEKIDLNSDTIESDSQTQNFTRPMTRSLARRKVYTRKQSKKSESTRTIDRKNCQRNGIFSFKGDLSGGLHDNNVDDSLHCKREKIMGMSSGVKTNQGVKQNYVEERQLLEKSRPIPAVVKPMVRKNKVSNASSSNERRNDALVEPKQGTKNNSSFELPLNAMTDQRDVEKSIYVKASKKNIQKDIANSPLKRKRSSLQPKRGTNNDSSFEFSLNAMTDKRDVEKSMDVESLKKNLQEDVSDSPLIKKRNSLQPKKGTKNNSSFEFPLNAVADQLDAEASTKNLEEDAPDPLSKKKRHFVHDPSSPPSEIKSRGNLQKSKQEEPNGRSSAKKIFNTTSIRSFQSLLSSKSTEREADVQQEPSVCRYKQNNSPKSCLPIQPNIVIDEDSDDKISKSSTDETDSESSEEESHKDCKESEELTPEIRISEDILHNSNQSFGNDKDIGVVGSSPASDSLKGVQDACEIGMYMEENQEDALTRAVALFTVALGHVKAKLKSISSRRSADILRAAVEDVLSRLQSAESLIKTDVGKLANLSHSKNKQLETRFQEKQEQLLGIHKRFKAEVEQHLQDCGSLIEDLEEHQVELKSSVEKQRAAHKKFLSQVEQEISVQLDDAESRIMAVQEMARKKMLHLKRGVAECLQHGALS